jgi:oxygen-independent coproporphyrinogen-3 oxidase
MHETISSMTGLHSGALGLYISIPFCRSKCTYCNFASGVYPKSEHARYVDRLIEDLSSAREWAARMAVELQHRVDTVYLGGGTPTLLAPELLARLFAAMRAEFDLDPDAEITVECAPGQLADDTLEALVRASVNRVSLGVQSFIDREAAISGRLHNRATVEQDLRRLRAAGIANLSVDLIAGLAGQTFASWRESLTALIDSGVPHASVYMLEVDEDSRLGREVLAHGVRYHAGLVPSDDAIAQMYSVAIERLAAAGLVQYEISNFCQPGFASRHNLRYWQRRPYLGLGLDASSMLRAARTAQSAQALQAAEKPGFVSGHDFSRTAERLYAEGGGGFNPRIKPTKSSRALAAEVCCSDVSPANALRAPSYSSAAADERVGNRESQPETVREAGHSEGLVLRSTTTDDLAAYLAGAAPAEAAWLSPARQHEEAWFLGLRLNAGVDVSALEREFGAAMTAPALEAVARLVESGLLTSDARTVRLTAQGQLLSNNVFQEFLELVSRPALKTGGS